MKRYWIKVYGCQMNERDAEIIAGLLEKEGYREAPSLEQADIILLHTCCVREKAENKVYGLLGHLARLKSKNPGLVIAVGGCMTQQPGAAEKMRERAPYVDLIYGTHNIHELPRLLEQVEILNRPVAEIWEEEGEIVEGLPVKRTGGVKALVTISYGCNNFCSYCIVPYVRGRERSRRPEDIMREIKSLVAEGVLEVMLLGQNVNSYGRDLEGRMSFGKLLEMVNGIEGLRRIRYMTSHPRDFTQELIETLSRLDKVCEHVHLPVQAGSNKVLRLMNRGYTREEYLALVDNLRQHIPGVSLTTDIIVGFPGETEEDFADTLDLVERVQFDNAFTFMYSPRRGTTAATLPGQVPVEIKKERLRRLMELQYRISREKNEALVGQEVEVLVEGLSENDATKLCGRTRTNKLVIFSGPESIIGKFVSVKITVAQTWLLKGEVVA
ncbi:MAG: tRNA (N6-isopentenyl adenosine(37)-C2)-methylthiotransferase MiaB [Moorellaceae bacterium]